MMKGNHMSASFADRLSKLMTSPRGINQAQLSRATGISVPALINYRRGRIPRAEQLATLARHFGVTIDDLLAAPPQPKMSRRLEQQRDVIEAILLNIASGIRSETNPKGSKTPRKYWRIPTAAYDDFLRRRSNQQ